MALFSILLIENQISVATAMTQAIGQHLLEYRLVVAADIGEAIADPKPVQVILLNLAQLGNDVCARLTSLSQVFPDTPVILLQADSGHDATQEQKLLEALAWGVSDYAVLAKAGFQVLGKRLAGLQHTWAEQRRLEEVNLTSRDLLYKAIISDTSQLAIQFIGSDNRIHAWNRAAELLFGLDQQSLGGLLIESLPLLRPDLKRFKDILEQVRRSSTPVFVPNLSLKNEHGETQWVQLHVYPIQAESSQLSDICLIGADITDIKRTELQTWQYSQELQILLETSSAIAVARNTGAVLNTLIRQMTQVLNVSSGHIVSWDKNQRTGLIQAEFPSDEAISATDGTERGLTFNLGKRPSLSAIQHQQSLVFQLSDPGLDEAERREMIRRGCVSRLLVPLIVKGEAIGWAELWETRQERLFSTDEIRLARMLANQAAVALENLQYLKQTQQTLEETHALYQVASALANTQDAQTIMSTVLQEYLRALDLKQGSVIIFDFETKVGVVQVNFQDDQPALAGMSQPGEIQAEGRPQQGLEGWQFPLRNNPLYERLMATHQPVIIDDTQGKLVPFLPKAVPPLPALIRLGWAGPETLSLLAIPVQIRGEIVAALVAEATRHKYAFTPAEITLGQAMADQLGVGLQNVRLYEAEYQRRQQAETLREVSLAVGSSLNLNEVLERILDQLARVIKYDSAAIHLIEGKSRRIIAGRGFPNPKKIIGLTFPGKVDDDHDPGTLAIKARQPLVVGNVPASYNIFNKSPQDKIKSWMGIPLIARDKVIGLISINHTQANAYDEDDLHLALAFANQVVIALENARLYEIEVRELERELEIAQSIQETLLPQMVPQVPGLEISGRILPARQIGGDFFHFFSMGKDQLGVAVGDVSGKGIPAALYMAVAITAIDAQIRADVGPSELLNKLNHILYNRLRENKMNVALQVAIFAPLPAYTDANGQHQPQGVLMTVASAGMISPIGATEHGCHFLPVAGLPVGALSFPEQTYQDDTFLLDPFTTIIFTSDGIVEAQNEARELFGFDRLEATINEVISTRDAEVIAEHIINTAQEFVGQAEQNDDMTVVVVVKK